MVIVMGVTVHHSVVALSKVVLDLPEFLLLLNLPSPQFHPLAFLAQLLTLLPLPVSLHLFLFQSETTPRVCADNYHFVRFY